MSRAAGTCSRAEAKVAGVPAESSVSTATASTTDVVLTMLLTKNGKRAGLATCDTTTFVTPFAANAAATVFATYSAPTGEAIASPTAL